MTQAQTEALFQYRDSGLDWVYLVGGVRWHDTPGGGRGYSISNIDGLHDLIARTIIDTPNRLRGQEVAYLRSMLDLSQQGLSEILGVTRVQVARWEIGRDKGIPGTADRALRLFYAGKIGGDKLVTQICDLLTEIDDIENKYPNFNKPANMNDWQRKAA